MKYIVEVLSSNSSGTRTQIYNSKDAVEAALDNWGKHRPGQPVVALYYDTEDNNKLKALIAVGITAPDKYYIINEGDIYNNYHYNQVVGSNVIIDPIDITELLSSHGPGQEFEGSSYVPFAGAQRHFGWLGTTEASWAVNPDNNKIYTNRMTAQQLFEAILYGQQVDHSVTLPDLKISLKYNGNWECPNLTVINSENQEIPVNVKFEITNIDAINYDDFTFTIDGINNVEMNDSGIVTGIYTTRNEINKEFTITAVYKENTNLKNSATGILNVLTVDTPEPEEEHVETEGYQFI